MRVRWTYVLTGALVTVALGAPFALPRVLDSQGSAAFPLRAAAPPAADTAVVQMTALPRPKRVVRAPRVLVRAASRVVASRSSLASVRIRTGPATPAPAGTKQSIRRHPPAPVDTRRAPDPAPAPPTASVTPLAPQAVNLNSSDPATAAAPTLAPVAAATAPVTSTPAPGVGRDDPQHQAHGQGHGHDHDHDH
jgi:hypothetical protein